MSRLKNLRLKLWASLLLALLVGTPVVGTPDLHADFALTHWQFFKPVVLPPSLAAGQLVELPLDAEVFRETNPGETDLRLIAGSEREVPYQLVIEGERSQREAAPAIIQDIGYVPGAYSSFVADLGGQPVRHNEVEIATDGINFRRAVTVETSADGEVWATVQDDAEIYDFTSADEEFNVHHTRIEYPESTARYLRVRVPAQDVQPLKIDGASVFLYQEAAARETAYLPTSVSTTEDAAAKATGHDLELAAGIPVSRLSFQADAINFYRQATIEGSEDSKVWQWLAEGEIYSFDTARFSGSRLDLEFPESRFPYYRLTVANGDDLPVQLTGFTGHGVNRKLLFRPEPGSDYALYYGNPLAVSPTYDLAQALPYLETGDLPFATLGGQQPNRAFSGFDLPLTERLPWLLPAGVGLAALMVAALLYGVVRQARKVLPPPGDGSTSSP